jgi:phospholipid/cholesterol/gamma-HCH transport system substrate-binding protein
VASLLAVAGLVVATVVLLLRGGGTYVIHAHFVDAGQLVKGNLVQVAGQRIGTVVDIRLTNRNEADVVLRITDGEFTPLHRGTVASIRTLGLAGIANRFVNLSPGPASAPEIPDGGVLTTTETRPIVDLDEVLNALDPRTRTHLQGLIRNGAKVFAGSTLQANRAFHYLNPALSQSAAFSAEVTRDEFALQQLIASTATVSTALASRRPDLEEGIDNTAATLRALASERAALDDVLVRAPAVMRRSRPTLRELRGTLSAVRPALREARPVAAPLARVLRQLVPTARDARPVVADLLELMPDLHEALGGVPELADVAEPTLDATTRTLDDALPIFEGLRPFAPDLITGILNGFGGTTAGYYDANGHFGRIQAMVGPAGVSDLQPLVDLLEALFPGLNLTLPGLDSVRTGLDARCPGAAVEPARDGTNPWIPDESICDPKDNF